MKKLFLLLVIFIGCMGQEAAFVQFRLGNENGEIIEIPQIVVDKSTYLADMLETMGEEVPLLPPGFDREDIDNIVNYMQTEDVTEHKALLARLDRGRLHNFLRLLDALLFEERTIQDLKDHVFDMETIKELSALGIACELFEKSLKHLINTDKKAACKLYFELEDGNQIKNLLGNLFPLWQIQQRLGQVNNQDPSVGHIGTVYSVAVSADGQTIVSGAGDNTVIVWQKKDVDEWQIQQRLGQVNNQDPSVGHIGTVYSVAVSADGQTIVSGSGDRTVIVWQKHGEQWHMIQRLGEVGNKNPEVGHTSLVRSVALSADGETIVSGSWDNTVIVWQEDGGQWQLRRRLGQEYNDDPSIGHTDDVESVSLSADGQMIVSGSSDFTVIIWQKHGEQWQLRRRLGQEYNQDPSIGHTNDVESVSLSADGQMIVSGSRDNTVIVWQKESLEDYCAEMEIS